MRFYLTLGLVLVAFAAAHCSPVMTQWDEDNSQLGNFKFPIFGNNNQLIEKHRKLVEAAKSLFDKLRAKGQNDKAEKLWEAIECANRSLQAWMSINPGRDFNFSIKAIIANLMKAQERLDHLIKDLESDS